MSTMGNDYWSKEFLEEHIRRTMAFYDPVSMDSRGGFFHWFKDDGTVYDRDNRHLVSSCRFVYNNAMAWLRFGRDGWRERTGHGLTFLRSAHYDAEADAWDWTLRLDDGPGESRVVATDRTRHCYGLAFVMLAQACGLKAGFAECRDEIAHVWQVMDDRFYEPAHGAYASEASPDWQVSKYRGQNDNMHACEALIAAFEATGEARYLERAAVLADTFTRRLCADTAGQIWEHYHQDWQPDLDYNKGDRSNIFRPWGIQTGHQTEWAKLLLLLDQYQGEAWHLERARELFETAMLHGWDQEHGGLRYGYDLAGAPYDDDKYFLVQAESLAAAAMLARRTGAESCADWYQRIWDYSDRHFVDHRYGAWYRILSPDNCKYSDEKSPAGKTDYHTMGACHQVLAELERG